MKERRGSGRDEGSTEERQTSGLAQQRGVTLVEVLIVVAIMALISAGVGFVVIKKVDTARRKTTLVRAEALRAVAIQYVALGPGGCPSTDELVAEGELEENTRLDAWDRPFEITCETDTLWVRSNGADRVASTEDDIYVPVSQGPIATR